MLGFEHLIYAALGLLAGVSIGCVGVGGVILVPLLAYTMGVPIPTAIAGAMFAYLISGAVGTWTYASKGSIEWGMAGWLWLGAMPAALGGALAVSLVSPRFLELLIGALTIASGAQSLLNRNGSDAEEGRAFSRGALVGIGGVTGVGSAMTGTGGPLVLVPIMLWLEAPVLTAIGLSQAIQLPIATLATLGNAYTGALDLSLGLALGVGISFGSWTGARLAHVLPRKALKNFVSALLVLVGSMILIKTLLALLAS